MDGINRITGAQSTAWATEADWTRHQARIADLYRNYTLAKTMKIMEDQHGLKATCANTLTRLEHFN